MNYSLRQLILWGALGLIFAAGASWIYRLATTPEGLLWVKENLYWPTHSVFKQVIFRPAFVIAVTLILLVEHFYPVKPEQKTFSVGFMQDSVWLILALLFEGMVVGSYTKWLNGLYTQYLTFLHISALERSPEIIRFTFGVLVADFLSWFQHWVKHKVPWFWEIHALHHSQREMNMFTDFRFHFMEYIISKTIVVIPLLILGISLPKIVAFVIFNMWLTRFYHANIKTNLGPLRYILVTPQSHRIHHSIEKKHQDLNFGVLFSIWDRMFKTQYHGDTEYPETGIRDTDFPLEQDASGLSLIIVPLKQLIYPFIVIGHNILRRPGEPKGRAPGTH